MDVRADHGRGYVTVAEDFLHGPNVVAVREVVGRERVPQRMQAAALGDVYLPHCAPDLALQERLVEMVTAALTAHAIQVDAGSGEDPLPHPLSAVRYVRASAVGSSTQPGPIARSRSCCVTDAVQVPRGPL